jgi:peptide/nickel transport system ATP-binding protein
MTLVEITDLETEYRTQNGSLRAVDDVDLSIEEGEMLGIVGESGCGKTTLAKSILRLLDENGHITAGEINYRGEDIAQLSDEMLRERFRWTEISYIPQSAMAALDPVYRAGEQVVEVIREHTDRSREQARERTRELFVDVGLDPDRVHDYPHELSGGQRQRVVIALALALSPSLVIADEPTTD